MAEILKPRLDADPTDMDFFPKHGERWGRWRFDFKAGALEYMWEEGDRRGYQTDEDGNKYIYCINLGGQSSENILRIPLHVATKEWVTAEDLGNLVRALNKICDLNKVITRLAKKPK